MTPTKYGALELIGETKIYDTNRIYATAMNSRRQQYFFVSPNKPLTAHIEGTQRGFVVWVKTNRRSEAQLTDATEDYRDAQATATSINRGRWTGRRKGAQFNIRDKTLSVTPVFCPS